MMNLSSHWRNLWQKKGEKQLDSLGITKEDFVFQPEPIPFTTSLLRTCKTIFLSTFIDCYCHEIYTGLGTGTPEEVAEAWNEIVSEWSGLMKNEDADYLLDLAARILAIKSHLSFVENAVFLLQRRYSKDIIEKLINEYGYYGEYPEDNRDAYLAQLTMVLNLSKTHAYALVELQEEMNRLENNSKGAKLDEEGWQKDISKVSRYQGYPINKYKTYLFDYVMDRNNFIEEIKNANKQNKPPDI